jgi:hypothetical protein
MHNRGGFRVLCVGWHAKLQTDERAALVHAVTYRQQHPQPVFAELGGRSAAAPNSLGLLNRPLVKSLMAR